MESLVRCRTPLFWLLPVISSVVRFEKCNNDMVKLSCVFSLSFYLFAGENIKALLMTLSKSSKVVDPGEDKHGKMVFYDFVGFFMVAYPQRMAVILNWSTLAYALIAILKRHKRDWQAGMLLCSSVIVSIHRLVWMCLLFDFSLTHKYT